MIVAREHEIALLYDARDSEVSQFVAIYGRRRVGKTFLVREAFDYTFTFQHSGLANGTLKEQLFAFRGSLKDAGLPVTDTPRNWLEAFELLKDLVRSSSDERKVIFLDELSWMDTPRSDFMVALESFWNGWASARRDIVLVVCASATSWMLKKVIHNKGGLYNRLTKQIRLAPFTLGECSQFIHAKDLIMNTHQLLECYMVLGGVPFYWDCLQKGLSLPQNIDALFFAKDARLADEFDYLFSSLFRYPEGYIRIIEALAKHKAGMTRKEILATTGLADSGKTTTMLEELESCGFIRRFHQFGRKSRGDMFQLVDNYTLFHYKFLQNKPGDEHFWENTVNSPMRNAWCGIAFERVCLEHVPQIKAALGISGVQTEVSSWQCDRDDERGIYGSQIDLLIVRRDQVINLCEMKFSADEYAMTDSGEQAIRRKISDLRTLSNTRSAIHVTLVTPYGLRRNSYAGVVQAVVTAENLRQL